MATRKKPGPPKQRIKENETEEEYRKRLQNERQRKRRERLKAAAGKASKKLKAKKEARYKEPENMPKKGRVTWDTPEPTKGTPDLLYSLKREQGDHFETLAETKSLKEADGWVSSGKYGRDYIFITDAGRPLIKLSILEPAFTEEEPDLKTVLETMRHLYEHMDTEESRQELQARGLTPKQINMRLKGMRQVATKIKASQARPAKRATPKPEPKPEPAKAPIKTETLEPGEAITVKAKAAPLVPPTPAAPPVTPKPKKSTKTSVLVSQAGKREPRRLPAEYKIAKMEDVITSHDPLNFYPNDAYPENVQERDYSGDSWEQLKVTLNSEKLTPEYMITDNPDSVNGPPIVALNGVVLGGNSRAMSLERAYHYNKGKEYLKQLKERAADFGIDPATINEKDNPILVRVVNVGEGPNFSEWADLSRRLNESQTQEKDAATDAVSLSKRLTDRSLQIMAEGVQEEETLNQFLTSGRSVDFVESIRTDGIIEARNAGLYLDGNKLSEEGRSMVTKALVAKMVPNAQQIERLGPMKRDRIARVVPAMVSARAAGHDLSPDLQRAAEDIAEKEARGFKSLSDLEKQEDLFKGKPAASKEAKEIARLLDEKPADFVATMRTFANKARMNRADQGGLFGPGPNAQGLFAESQKEEETPAAQITETKAIQDAKKEAGIAVADQYTEEEIKVIDQPSEVEPITAKQQIGEMMKNQQFEHEATRRMKEIEAEERSGIVPPRTNADLNIPYWVEYKLKSGRTVGGPIAFESSAKNGRMKFYTLDEWSPERRGSYDINTKTIYSGGKHDVVSLQKMGGAIYEVLRNNRFTGRDVVDEIQTDTWRSSGGEIQAYFQDRRNTHDKDLISFVYEPGKAKLIDIVKKTADEYKDTARMELLTTGKKSSEKQEPKPKKKSAPKSNDFDQFLKDNFQQMKNAELAEKTGRNVNTIRRRLSELKLKREKKQKAPKLPTPKKTGPGQKSLLWEDVKVKEGTMDFEIVDLKAWGEPTDYGRYNVSWSNHSLRKWGDDTSTEGPFETKKEARAALMKNYEAFYLYGGFE